METVNEELNIDKNLEDKIRSYSNHIESIYDKELSVTLAFLQANSDNEMVKNIVKPVMEYLKLCKPHMFPEFDVLDEDEINKRIELSAIEIKYTLKDLKEIVGKIGELTRRNKNANGGKSILDGLALVILSKEMIYDISAISNETGKSVEDLLHEAVFDWINLKKEEAAKEK